MEFGEEYHKVLCLLIQADHTNLLCSREGILYSLLILFQKTGLAVALSGSSYILGWMGYETTAEKTDNGQGDDYQVQYFITPIHPA